VICDSDGEGAGAVVHVDDNRPIRRRLLERVVQQLFNGQSYQPSVNRNRRRGIFANNADHSAIESRLLGSDQIADDLADIRGFNLDFDI
jgi:hypothetical protein